MSKRAKKDSSPSPPGVFSPDYSLPEFQPNVLLGGEGVLVTEFLDGEKIRLVFADDKLWVHSGGAWSAEEIPEVVTRQIREAVHLHPLHVFYGVVSNDRVYCYDILNPDGQWVAAHIARIAGVPPVPEVYRGPFSMDMMDRLLVNRRGIVIQAIDEREVAGVGRLKLKLLWK